MKMTELKDLTDGRTQRPRAATCARSFSNCASSRPAANSRPGQHCALLRRDMARLETRLSQLRYKPA